LGFCLLLVCIGLSLIPLLYITASVIDFDTPDDIKATKLHNYVLWACEPKEDGVIDFWQHPLLTVIRGSGDCEDIALLEWTLFRLSGLDASLVYGTLRGSKHFWVEYQGEIWEARAMRPLGPAPIHYKPIFRIP